MIHGLSPSLIVLFFNGVSSLWDILLDCPAACPGTFLALSFPSWHSPSLSFFVPLLPTALYPVSLLFQLLPLLWRPLRGCVAASAVWMRELFELALLQLEVWFLVSGYTPQPTTRVELGAHQEKSYE